MTAHSGEFFARLDSPWHVFLKGYIGLGRITGGTMNDEDWGLTTAAPFTGYSNTSSGLSDTNMNYGTIDLGYDVLHGPGYKVGVFAGYSHIFEQYAATDCTQIASPSSGICAPTISNTPSPSAISIRLLRVSARIAAGAASFGVRRNLFTAATTTIARNRPILSSSSRP